MKLIALLLPFIVFAAACTNSKTVQVDLPPAPANIDSVKKIVAGKNYKTEKLAQISNLVADKNDPYEWFEEMKDTTPFFKNYQVQRMKFGVQFTNDSVAVVTDEKGTNQGLWSLDDQPGKDDTPGIFLRIAVSSEEKLFAGQTGATTMTYTFKVLGLSEKQLFLQTPNVFNMRKIAVLMKTE
jgi:hypothetical protein